MQPNLVENQHYPKGTLYMVGMPIGNAGDISLRALHILSLVDSIAAEDTRHTSQLLQRYGLQKPLIAAHQHNEAICAEKIVMRLLNGERIAYVSDAGTPGLSDPGARLVDRVRQAGLNIMPIPGASALSTAISVTGNWLGQHFIFIGFLPSKNAQRLTLLESLTTQPRSFVLYEAPHRIRATISALIQLCEANRRVLIARELTKQFETIHECALGEALAWLDSPDQERGEFVLIVEGAAPPSHDALSEESDRILKILLKSLSIKQSVELATEITKAPKKQLYQRALTVKELKEAR